VNQVGLLVVILIAAGTQGGYTAYASAFTFFQLPHGIFAVSIMTALLPSMSALWVEGDRDEFRQNLVRGIRSTAFIVLPAALGYIALATPIVRLLLEHGVASGRSTRLVAGVLTMFSIGLLSFSAFQLFLRAFYAMQDTRTPALINVFAVGLNTAVNVVYYRLLGVRGLALGHATAYTFAAIAAVVILSRRLQGLEWKRLVSGLGRIVVAAAMTGASAWLVSRFVGERFGTATLGDQLLQVGSGVVVGVAVFVAASIAFRIEEFALVKGFLLRRLRRPA
jgi:putative peptidoglycan lipid II flippase